MACLVPQRPLSTVRVSSVVCLFALFREILISLFLLLRLVLQHLQSAAPDSLLPYLTPLVRSFPRLLEST